MATNNEYVVYMLKNKINKKIYIGQSSNIKLRWEYNGIHYRGSHKIYNAIQKYGWDNFEHIILEENLTCEQANEREQFYIKFYNSVEEGYNIKYGGSNSKCPPEMRKKISESNKKTFKKKFEDVEYREQWHERQINCAGKTVKCLNNNLIFRTQTEAAQWCGLKSSGPISACCRGKRKTAGKDPITGEKLQWIFIEKKEEN